MLPIKKNQLPILNDFFTAVSFLTIIPVSVEGAEKKNALASAMIFFPLVGFGIAGVSFGLVHFWEPFLSERISNLLLVLLPILFSGGLHIDGVADFFDGFFQGKNREDILRVMKDPHIGVWGSLSIVFFVLIKWEPLMIVPFKGKIFLIAMTLSRWAQVFLSYSHSYAGKETGLGESVAQKIGRKEFAGATVFTFLAALLLGWKGLCVFLGIFLFVLGMGAFYKKKINGITGDLIGATAEMSELAAYVLFITI